MIQLNLLPDIKLDYIKAQRMRRLVISASVVVASASIAILVILLGIGVAQRHHLSNLTNQVDSETTQLKGKPNINQVLTVQGQLQSLNTLHSDEPAVASLLNKYLNEVTPASVAISELSVNFTTGTIAIDGTAPSLSDVNQYVDCLKYTTYNTNLDKTENNAFSDVVLSSFGYNGQSTNPAQAASYTIDFNYDKTIFNIADTINLTVPTFTTTRAEVPQPGALFKVPPASSSTSGSSTSQSSSGGQ